MVHTATSTLRTESKQQGADLFAVRSQNYLQITNVMSSLLSDFDMKKDIEVLIAEERAEIISKYDKVRNTVF